MRVAVLNAGSSSLKHALVEAASGAVLAAGEARWPSGEPLERHRAAMEDALGDLATADAVGHRIVHGGSRAAPAIVDAGLVAELREAAGVAPLHAAAGLAGIEAAQ